MSQMISNTNNSPIFGNINSNRMPGGNSNMGREMHPDMDPLVGMHIYKPQGDGMMLADLIKNGNTIGSNVANRQDCNRSANYDQKNNSNIFDDRKVEPNEYSQRIYNKNQKKRNDIDSDLESNYDNIRKLATDVNNSLIDLENIKHSKKTKKINDLDTNDSEKDTSDDLNAHVIVNTVEYEINYFKTLTEFVLLLTLYVIMSQSFVVSFASKFILQLNPSDEGIISMTGLIIYGLILTTMFMIFRKIFFLYL